MAQPITQITQTGMKGFLLWFAREQPAIYAKIAPKLPAAAPKAFGNYMQMQKRLGEIYKSKPFPKSCVSSKSGMAGFGDYYGVPGYTSAPAATISPDFYAAYSAAPGLSFTPSDPNTILGDVPDVSVPTSSPSIPIAPIANAANSGVISSRTASAIGSVIGATSAILMTNSQAALQQQAVNANLARAAAGLPPLNTSLNSLGVPTVGTSGSIDSGTMLLLGLAAVAAVVLTSK
jgi:hypothetical protein